MRLEWFPLSLVTGLDSLTSLYWVDSHALSGCFRHRSPQISTYLTYGLVWGFGSCLCYCSTLFLLPQFFRARLGLANGIVFFGAPVGTLVYSAVMQKLFSYLGLAKTFRVFAGVQLVLVLCGFITRSILSLGFNQIDVKNIKKTSFDWSIFKNKGFMVFVVSLCVFMPGYLVPYVHLVSCHIVPCSRRFVHPLSAHNLLLIH